ncbi:MAG: hypothetical protein EZS28_038221, partial [Streblomastix strix]
MVSVFQTICSGLALLVQLLLSVYHFFVIVTIQDLEEDTVASKDFCDQLNPLVLPTYIIHASSTLILLISRRWISLIVCIPGV